MAGPVQFAGFGSLRAVRGFREVQAWVSAGSSVDEAAERLRISRQEQRGQLDEKACCASEAQSPVLLYIIRPPPSPPRLQLQVGTLRPRDLETLSIYPLLESCGWMEDEHFTHAGAPSTAAVSRGANRARLANVARQLPATAFQ
ncbi:hypothetical protein GGTG_01442 [Gaeumannomyces tritici R3-111a-1]|uniref:Uncharacterized protein n=1 Tax=Gaeumannomyces tritici (strain R3-111a-1) TaxID=644352 RepID=J3NJL2_GAET3|nr:hypothetical protein GGTG_01442 [Gaeumannomyces tritici R3-111a-1]EJT81464.1 hypothetical protein GGTG_01442 [Gaeumannomyces tritici R3-111a-1]